MRPVHRLLFTMLALLAIGAGLIVDAGRQRARQAANSHLLDIATAGMGLTDLCVATEARYTRHPAVSDRLVPFMDHPGSIEHFPTGSFWAPPYP